MALSQEDYAALAAAGATDDQVRDMFGEDAVQGYAVYQAGGPMGFGPTGVDPWTYLTQLDTAGYDVQGNEPLRGMPDPRTLTPQERLGAASMFGIQPTDQLVQQAGVYNQNQATNDRFGNDMAWLDPAFSYTPTLLGTSAASQAHADPASIAAQQATMQQIGQLYGTPMEWMSGDQQQAMYNQLLNVAPPQWDTQAASRQNDVYNQLGRIQGPQFESSQRQEDVYNKAMGRAMGRGAPQFLGDQDQRAVLEELQSIARSGGAQGINYDTSGRQEEQYGNLDEIIAGRGASAIEMANRQKQRADQEQWLRSQREALQRDYAMRGLTGSGQELLALGQAQQGAAGRNSLADLETAKQLEQRRMDAIGQAAGLATNMRAQTAAEQQFNAARGDLALRSQGDMATALRQADYLDKSYLDQSMLQALGLSADQANQLRNARMNEEGIRTGFELNRANSQGNLASTMRGQTYEEQAYQNQAAQNQAIQAAAIAATMRNQTFNENSFARNNQTQLLGMNADLSSNMRTQSFNESYLPAQAADDFAAMNASFINQAGMADNMFRQQSYQNMITQRNATDRLKLQLGTNVAGGLMQTDAQAAQFDAAQRDQARQQYLAAYNAAYGNIGPQPSNFQNIVDASKQGTAVIGGYIGGKGGGAVGGGGSANVQSVPNYTLIQPQIGQSSGYSGQPNYGTSVTGTSTQPQNYGVTLFDEDKLKYG